MTHAAGEKQHAGSDVRVAIDIGSTIVKVARVASDGELLGQEFYPRDFDAGIARQVESIVNHTGFSDEDVLICSSANGGLRVGILCLTEHFSGATLGNQVLLAGANPVFACGLDDRTGNTDHVDILIVGGGIDCAEGAPRELRLSALMQASIGSLLWRMQAIDTMSTCFWSYSLRRL